MFIIHFQNDKNGFHFLEKSILKTAKINENKDFGSIDESNNQL